MAGNDYYISSGNSDSKSWFMTARKAPMPSPKRVQIDDIPYRDGAIDLSMADGVLHYECREIEYQFMQSFESAFAAAEAIDTLTAWLTTIWNADLYDSANGATYKHARCLSVESDGTSRTPTVTVKFEADPRKGDGTL